MRPITSLGLQRKTSVRTRESRAARACLVWCFRPRRLRREPRARAQFQLGRAADPVEQLLPLPRPRRGGAQGGPAPRSREAATAELPETPGKARDRARQPRGQRADPPRVVDGPRRRHAAAGHAPRADRPTTSTMLKRWIEAGAEYQPHWSFIAPADPMPPQATHDATVVNDIDRFIGAKLDAARAHAGAGGRPRDADPPRHVHADGPARDAGRGRSVPRRHRAERLRASRRPPARLAGVRRAPGDRMARRRALRRLRRLSRRRVSAPALAVARLGHRGVQREPAVRRVRHRAARRRLARRRDESAAHRDRRSAACTGARPRTASSTRSTASSTSSTVRTRSARRSWACRSGARAATTTSSTRSATSTTTR